MMRMRMRLFSDHGKSQPSGVLLDKCLHREEYK